MNFTAKWKSYQSCKRGAVYIYIYLGHYKNVREGYESFKVKQLCVAVLFGYYLGVQIYIREV